MEKIFVTSFIALFQSIVFTQPNDLEAPISFINYGLDAQAQMGSVFTLDSRNNYDPNGTIVFYDWNNDIYQLTVTGTIDDGGQQQIDLSEAKNNPESFKLNQNFPNSFKPVTILSYDLR